jgi:hypothetical protein
MAMADLQDLIDIPLDEISDEELERLVMHGRLVREESTSPKAKAAKKSVTATNLNIDYDEFE